MRIYEFVREHVIPFNAVILMSITVAAVLDFLAPQAAYLAWLSYVIAGLVLTVMVLELLHQRAAENSNSLSGRLLGRLRSPPGPLWNSPGWQVIGVIAVLALVLGYASKARASDGGLIASSAPNLRNVQVLLLGLQQDTQRIQTTLDGMVPKVDSIQASVGTIEAALKEPRDFLAEGDYPYLQKLVASGKKLPQHQWNLMLGLNQKRADRLDLLRLYVENGFDIRQAMPVFSNAILGGRIDDIPTLRNLQKLQVWVKKHTTPPSLDDFAFMCSRMDLLTYAYIADDQALADWLIKQGINPRQQYDCKYIDKPTMSSRDVLTLLSQ